MYRLFLLCLSFLLVLVSATCSSASPEVATLAVTGEAQVVDQNFSAARTMATASAFANGVIMASKGILMDTDFSIDDAEKEIIDHAEDFVTSYKYLEQVYDPAQGKVTVRLSVTLFIGELRSRLRSAGFSIKKRDMPSLLVIIDEQTSSFFSGTDFLVLDSDSEDLLASALRDRGYKVYGRQRVRELGLKKDVLKAFRGDKTLYPVIAEKLDADLILLGKSDIDSIASSLGEDISVDYSIDLFAPAGESLYSKHASASGTYAGDADGSKRLIDACIDQIIRDMALRIPRLYKAATESNKNNF